MSDSGHGSVGQRAQPFSRLIEEKHPPFDVGKLFELSRLMQGGVDTVKDGPDPEENLWVPAGYTYFGQFIDHDLTFDSTSSLNPEDTSGEHASRIPSNLRTPRFDLDCLYGDGPAAQPFMYADDGATLLYGGTGRPQQRVTENGQIVDEMPTWDLLRAPTGRAIIGDKRNDENSIVCQIQLAFVKYHNAMVARLKGERHEHWNTPGDLFTSARNEVRWTYQWLIVKDFLPRIIRAEVLADLADKTPAERDARYALYEKHLRSNLPQEFVAAAYRYGHSGVRTGYRLNGEAGKAGGTRLGIFPASIDTNQATDSLMGFDPLPRSHVIDDWRRFFPDSLPGVLPTESRTHAAGDTPDGKVRLQLAYKLDPTLVDPLGVLPIAVAGGSVTSQASELVAPRTLPDPQRPSLALLNLLRGNAYGIQSGQALLAQLKLKLPAARGLDPKYLSVRRPAAREGRFQFVQIDPAFLNDTPLWFYVLAEGQQAVVDGVTLDADKTFAESQMLTGEAAKTQLGWVGGRIIAEVFYGLLDADDESVFGPGKPAHWKPHLGGDGSPTLLNFLRIAHA